MNKTIPKMNLILVLLSMIMMGFHPAVFGQGTIEGSVKGDDGTAVIGASVVLKGSTQGSPTNMKGLYKIENVSAGTYTLVVSSIGYSTKRSEVTVTDGGTTPLDFVLNQDLLELDAVVVTGVINARSKLESSVSITTLNPAGILQSAPRTTAEIFRTIPGIRAEASGGDGNTNITVRGVPISAGGSKYLQLQEDGLPILMFGDIAFATSDIFLRPDLTLARIEAIRGGSASTLSSNSPAGIINFISKNGSVQGGSLATTVGVDYNSFRTDFEYGSPIGNGLSFHIGGFMRQGEGPRDAGYLANKGYQLKANITKQFDRGYARLYYKQLNDRTAAYMPMPIQVTGSNSDPTWGSVDGFDAVSGTQYSPFLTQNFGLGANGGQRNVNVSDGMHPVSQAIGAEFVFDLGSGWSVENRGRMSFNSGRFVAPFTAAVGTTDDIINTIGGAVGRDLTGATLTYAHNGQNFNNPNGLAQIIHMFDTELNNFNSFVNDLKVSKEIGIAEVTVGYFKSFQNINMSWLWNSYLMEVNGQDGALLDITDAGGTQITESGKYAYGVPLWGNCCQVGYNNTYDISAPYAAIAIEASDNLNIDVSVRYDIGKVRGSGLGGTQGQIDVNNNGTIEPIEESVSVINNANPFPVNYDYDYLSYSLGGNYKLNSNTAVFARWSRGASAKADRATFPGSSYLDPIQFGPKDVIEQGELGYKGRFNSGGLFVTAFYAKTTEESGFEATTQQLIESDYRAVGLEVEGSFKFGNFNIRGAVTYTDAKITSGDNDGNKPRRQPDLMYNIIPVYNINGGHSIGLSLIGQSKAFAQDGNELVMPGYNVVNGFVTFRIADGFSATLNANNLFNTIGITESEEGSITEGQVNYVRARSISGRTIALMLRYSF